MHCRYDLAGETIRINLEIQDERFNSLCRMKSDCFSILINQHLNKNECFISCKKSASAHEDLMVLTVLIYGGSNCFFLSERKCCCGKKISINAKTIS